MSNNVILPNGWYPHNIISYLHPKTEWTYNKLKEHWKNNLLSQIEGVYEKMGNGINYKVSKRFYLTADIGYYHFLKLPGMIGLVNVQPFYPKPINNVIIGNLKIGFLL